MVLNIFVEDTLVAGFVVVKVLLKGVVGFVVVVVAGVVVGVE